MGTTLKFLSENTVRKCTFGKGSAMTNEEYRQSRGTDRPFQGDKETIRQAWAKLYRKEILAARVNRIRNRGRVNPFHGK